MESVFGGEHLKFLLQHNHLLQRSCVKSLVQLNENFQRGACLEHRSHCNALRVWKLSLKHTTFSTHPPRRSRCDRSSPSRGSKQAAPETSNTPPACLIS